MEASRDGTSTSLLREWVVREDLDAVAVPMGLTGVPVLHSVESACLKDPTAGERHDRAWVVGRHRVETAYEESTGERSVYFCELCVVRRFDSAPKEHPAGGNPLCPKCFLHHAGECV